MATVPSLKVVKTFTYKGAARNFSNRYYFTGDTPTTAGRWTALSDAVTAAEKAIYGNNVTITSAVGYAAGSDVPVHTKAYTLAGTYAPSGSPMAPGDAVLLTRYATADRTEKNHPLYLYNYYHGMYLLSTSAGDQPAGGQRIAHQTYAASWITGFSDGTVNHVRCGPNGNVAIGSVVATYISHRDFPRG